MVLSTDPYHNDWDEILLVAITTVPPKNVRPTDCLLQDWRLAGLSHPSWVRFHVATVHRNLVTTKLGQLTSRDLQAVEQCLRIATGL